jgi:hypothetical protein
MTMAQLLEDSAYVDCLHSEYFALGKHVKIFQQEFAAVSPEQLIHKICDTIVNDWQHWHIGNTLTWTPLRDLEITKIMLRVPIDQVLPQIMNSDFSRELILRTAPDLNRIISSKKNSGNYMSNLVSLYT